MKGTGRIKTRRAPHTRRQEGNRRTPDERYSEQAMPAQGSGD
jgi:hypothetical protein